MIRKTTILNTNITLQHWYSCRKNDIVKQNEAHWTETLYPLKYVFINNSQMAQSLILQNTIQVSFLPNSAVQRESSSFWHSLNGALCLCYSHQHLISENVTEPETTSHVHYRYQSDGWRRQRTQLSSKPLSAPTIQWKYPKTKRFASHFFLERESKARLKCRGTASTHVAEGDKMPSQNLQTLLHPP